MKMDRRLAEYILARITSGEYPVGTKIPSVRRLAAKFDMPFTTVHWQLRLLAEAGILQTLPGKGVFVARSGVFPRCRSKRKVAVITESVNVGRQTSISYLALLEFQRQALTAGFEVEIRTLPYTDLDSEVFRALTVDCCGAALFKEYDARMFEFDSMLPTVATLMRHSYGGRISLVNIDEDQMAELAVAYFQYYELRKIEIISGAPPVYRRRARTLGSLWREVTGDCRIREFPDTPKEYAADTGYFFTSDTLLRVAHIEYAERTGGRSLDRDFAVLGVDGKRRLNPDWPVFPTIAVDWREVGVCLFAELKRLIDAPDSERRSIELGGRLRVESSREELALPEDFAAARSDRYDGKFKYDFALTNNFFDTGILKR